MTKYVVCPIDCEPNSYDEIEALDEDDAVAEFAQKEYDEIEPFEEGEYSVYVIDAPDQYKHLGDYKANAEYDVRFYARKIKEKQND